MKQRIVVVSIDGVAPRFVTPAVMPTLCGLAREGASCFDARTVVPSITLPAHASMLRGIDPSVHAIVDNAPKPLSDEWPSFLRVARSHGLRTAAALNWAPVAGLVEPEAVDARYYLDGGYDPADDGRIGRAASSMFQNDQPDVMFVYFVAPDLAGHDHGWGSQQYLDALFASDQHLGDLVESIEGAAVLVTTDHGGHGNDHQLSEPIDQITFVTLRARDVEPATTWHQASVLDVAPTVAALAGFEPAPTWSGESLLGKQQPTVDILLDEVRSLAAHSYGENLTMLAHALQTADNARRGGGSDQLVLAGLLHDVGHLTDQAGSWGDPDHAATAGIRLQQLLPAAIVEPIRLHVDAKRWLVATDPTYHDELSEASKQTLRQQGGPLDDTAAAIFLQQPWASDAVALRRFDDHAKDAAATTPDIESYRELLADALTSNLPEPRATRNGCSCSACRDEVSGQSLLDVSDLSGWRTTGTSGSCTHTRNILTGDDHTVVAAGSAPALLATRLWSAQDQDRLNQRHPADRYGDIANAVTTDGIALVAGLDTAPTSVLDFARQLGHVRTTNYGELFDVVNRPAASNLAYTTMRLPLHTDNPYRDPVPTVQVLHCLKSAAPDGASFFCDGFAVAEQLRSTDPQAFDRLVTTLVTFRYASAEVDLVAHHPMIELDVDGSVRAVHVNHRSMVPLPSGPEAEAFYVAYGHFHALLNADANLLSTTLAEGDVAVFDNRRVLHARGGFRADQPRHLQGCYIDIDAVRSMVRQNNRATE